MRRVPFVALALASGLACASSHTHIESSWKDPHAQQLAFHRVLAVVVSSDPAVRHSMEDQLAHRLPNAFAAYRAVPDLAVGDDAAAREQLHNRLFDGAVVMRVVDVKNPQTYVPGTTWYSAHPSFYGYWTSSWTMVRQPGYLATDTLVTVETAVYSLADDKLLWAGRTGNESARSLDKLLDGTTKAVTSELREQGLVP